MGVDNIQRLVIANDTAANVESGVCVLGEVILGRNTATGALGYSVDGGTNWVWLPTSQLTFNDSEGNPVDVDLTASADGTSAYPARRDHRHHLGDHTHTATGGAVLQDEDDSILYDEDGSILMEEITII